MSDSSDTNRTVEYTSQGQMVTEHWARSAVTYEGAIESLQSEGIDLERVTAEDLHSVDMLHMGNLGATDSLSVMAGLGPNQKILDIGSGVGGPARRMADKYGATVWGVELSETLYQTALRLTDLVGLQDRVRFKHGSALDLPFGDEEFDAVVLQHVAMQIAEKGQLFSECARVIKVGGCLAMHEIFAGDVGTLRFPLAWATEPAMSALERFDECSERLTRLGFEVGEFIDLSDEGRKHHQNRIETRRAALSRNEGAEGLSAEVLESSLSRSLAMEHNLRTGALRVGMVVCRKAES